MDLFGAERSYVVNVSYLDKLFHTYGSMLCGCGAAIATVLPWG